MMMMMIMHIVSNVVFGWTFSIWNYVEWWTRKSHWTKNIFDWLTDWLTELINKRGDEKWNDEKPDEWWTEKFLPKWKKNPRENLYVQKKECRLFKQAFVSFFFGWLVGRTHLLHKPLVFYFFKTQQGKKIKSQTTTCRVYLAK